MSDVLEIERDGGVARVWLNRPDIRNAFNEDSIAALARTFAAFADDDAIRAVVLGGRGKAFCAGADLGWMRRMAGYTWDENRADARPRLQPRHPSPGPDQRGDHRARPSVPGARLGLDAASGGRTAMTVACRSCVSPRSGSGGRHVSARPAPGFDLKESR